MLRTLAKDDAFAGVKAFLAGYDLCEENFSKAKGWDATYEHAMRTCRFDWQQQETNRMVEMERKTKQTGKNAFRVLAPDRPTVLIEEDIAKGQAAIMREQQRLKKQEAIALPIEQPAVSFRRIEEKDVTYDQFGQPRLHRTFEIPAFPEEEAGPIMEGINEQYINHRGTVKIQEEPEDVRIMFEEEPAPGCIGDSEGDVTIQEGVKKMDITDKGSKQVEMEDDFGPWEDEDEEMGA